MRDGAASCPSQAHNNTLFVELSSDGEYWNVNSAGVFRKGYSKKKDVVWSSLPAIENEAADGFSEVSSAASENGTASELSGNSLPSTSEGKDKQSSSNDKAASGKKKKKRLTKAQKAYQERKARETQKRGLHEFFENYDRLEEETRDVNEALEREDAPSDLVAEAFRSPARWVRMRAAAHRNLPPSMLEEAMEHAETREYALLNDNLTDEQFRRAVVLSIEDGNIWHGLTADVRLTEEESRALMERQWKTAVQEKRTERNTGFQASPSYPSVLRALYENHGTHKAAQTELAHNENTPQDILEKMYAEGDADVRATLASNEALPPAVAQKLMGESDWLTRHALALNGNIPSEVASQLLRDANKEVRVAAAKTHTLSEAQQRAELKRKDYPVLLGLAKNPRSSKELLNALLAMKKAPSKWGVQREAKFDAVQRAARENLEGREASELSEGGVRYSKVGNTAEAEARDKAYADAVARGDMETAERMLAEEAERKGYSTESLYQGQSAFNGKAPSANEDYQTAEERKEAYEDGDFEGDWSLADELVRGVDMGGLERFRLSDNEMRHANEKTKESITNLRSVLRRVRAGEKNVTITMYRSVPADVKERAFRNGDWITPSRSYADWNADIHEDYGGKHQESWTGEYRIIEQEVPIEDVWWDGNDINEWGYDNGKSEAYKNTPNNRKAFSVTYDEEGNLIPLSQRFDEGKADARYSKGEQRTASNAPANVGPEQMALRDGLVDIMRTAGMDVSVSDAEGQAVLDLARGADGLREEKREDAKFADDLARYARGEMRSNERFSLGMPRGVAREFLPHLPIEMSQKVLRKSVEKKHSVQVSSLGELMSEMANPIMVFQRADNAVSFLTEIKDSEGRNVLVAIELNREVQDGKNVMEVNDIRSLHGRDIQNIVLPVVDNGTLRWVNKEKGLAYLSSASYNSQQEIDKKDLSRAANIVKDFENPKLSAENLREQRVWHGTPHDFDHFDHSKMGTGEGNQIFGWGTYVSQLKEVGEWYADTTSRRYGSVKHYATMTEEQAKRAEEERAELLRQGRAIDRKADQLKGFIGQYISAARNSREAAEAAPNEGIRDFHLRQATYEEKQIEKTQAEIDELYEIHKAITRTSDGYLEALSDFTEVRNKPSLLYQVEIPDDTGDNYFPWREVLSDEMVEHLNESLPKLGGDARYVYVNKGQTGERVYEHLIFRLGSDKAASMALRQVGYVGIRYFADAGKAENYNYVIFDERDAQIVDKVKLFRGEHGEVRGFAVGGRIYLDPKLASDETAIHEYTHLWADALRRVNAKEWDNVKDLLRGTPMWEETKRMYPELADDEDALADEVLAQYSGKRGAEKLAEAREKAMAGADGVFDKAKVASVFDNVRQALKRFWQGVADFLGLHFTSAEEVADKVLSDLLNGVNPNAVTASAKADVRAMEYDEDASSAREAADIAVTEALVEVMRKAGMDVEVDKYPFEVQQWNVVKKWRKVRDKFLQGFKRQHPFPTDSRGVYMDEDYMQEYREYKWQIERASKEIARRKRLLETHPDLSEDRVTDFLNIISDSEYELKKAERMIRMFDIPAAEAYLPLFEEDQANEEFEWKIYAREHGVSYRRPSDEISVGGLAFDGKKIAINPDALRPEVPIHEYTHVWAAMIRKTQPEVWEHIKKTLSGLAEWDLVRDADSYAYIGRDEERLADEVLAQFSGRHGAKRLAEAQERALLETDGVFDAARVHKLFADVRDALKRFWGAVAKMFGAEFKTPEDIADKVLADLLNWVNPVAVGSASVDGASSMAELSGEGDLERVNAEFNENLSTLTEETANSTIFQLGRPSEVLRSAGVTDKPIRLYGNKIVKKQGKHHFKLSDLQDLPKALAAPIAVFDTHNDGSRAVLTTLKMGNKNVLATITIGKGGADVELNVITSTYGKENESVVRWFNDGFATYINKEKALDFLASASAPIADAKQAQELSRVANIVNDFENPKLSGENIREQRNNAATAEMQAIKEQAQADGTFMLAPNGEPTNLTERQWLQVRTQAFKRWFGDWENNPEEASKVVDENGEPRVVHHLTTEQFTKFDLKQARPQSDVQGFFFSSGTEDWADMGDVEMEVFLNLRNPAEKPILDRSQDNAGIKAREELLSQGHDGAVSFDEEESEEMEYLVLNPEQVKSATDNVGAFDGTNADIREQRVWHGTPYDFDHFDHSKMGTEASSQAHGWGTYVVASDEVGKGYSGENGLLYAAEIPDESSNSKYLDLGAEIPKDEELRVREALLGELLNVRDEDSYLVYEGTERELRNELSALEGTDGSSLYGTISSYLGGNKEASQFLHRLGYVGLRYQVDATRNYVIFDEREGRSADEMSRDVREYLNRPDMLFRRVKNSNGRLKLSKRAAAYHPGRGVYRSSYKNARRLAATEGNIAYRTADHERLQEMDFVVGFEVKLSNNHTCLNSQGKAVRFHDMCDDLQGKYPKQFKFTGWHPHCRCFAVPILKTEDEMARDTERILEGEEPLPDSKNAVQEMPEAFTTWIDNNAVRIAAAHEKVALGERASIPFFLKDNFKDGKPEMGYLWNQKERNRVDAVTYSQLNKVSFDLANENVVTDNELNNALMNFSEANPQLFRGGFGGVVVMDNADAPLMGNKPPRNERGEFDKTKMNVLYINGATKTLKDGRKYNALEELKAAILQAKKGAPLSYAHEEAFEMLWHEIRHAGAIGWTNTNNKTIALENAMEVVNEACARYSYPTLVQSFGGKATHKKKILENGLGYQQTMGNFYTLLKRMKVSKKTAYLHFKDTIIEKPYETIREELISFVGLRGGYTKKSAEKLVSILDFNPIEFERILELEVGD